MVCTLSARVFTAVRRQAWKLQLTRGEGVWCLSLRRNKVLSGALICYRLSVNDVRQIRGQLIHLGSGTPHSLTAASWLLGLCVRGMGGD